MRLHSLLSLTLIALLVVHSSLPGTAEALHVPTCGFLDKAGCFFSCLVELSFDSECLPGLLSGSTCTCDKKKTYNDIKRALQAN